MPKSSKPRKKYKRKGLILDPVAYVRESLTPVANHSSYLVDLKIKNHSAMTDLVQGRATKETMNTLIATNNIVEAFFRMGFGREYESILTAGCTAITNISVRGATTGRFTPYASEINALNEHMELHDAQMAVVTVKDMEEAIKMVRREHAAGKCQRIIEGVS